MLATSRENFDDKDLYGFGIEDEDGETVNGQGEKSDEDGADDEGADDFNALNNEE